MVYITRKENFSAAHKLYREDWTLEKNLEIFGKCANPNWHGHNYDMYVTVSGEPDPETGFVINLKDLSEIIKRKVIDKTDHKNLNLDVDFMKGKLTSTENLVVAVWKEIEPEVKNHNCKLYCIKIVETEHNSVEYYGPDHR